MLFQEIPGHTRLKKTLISSFKSNHIAHAQLFSGLEGSAMLTMALAYTTFLMCEDKGEEDACGTCASCHKMKGMVHPDVHYFYPRPKEEKKQEDHLGRWREFVSQHPYGNNADWIQFLGTDKKVNQISRDDAREIVKRVSMKAFEGGFKIIFIWYPELMHPTAANAILKILEEPPENTIYLLITNNYENILNTIISRTQLVSVPVFENGDVHEYLVSSHKAEPQLAMKTAEMAEGNLRKAITLIELGETLEYEIFQDWMRNCWAQNYEQLVLECEEFNRLNKNTQRSRLVYALSLIRGSLMAYGTLVVAHATNEKKFLQDFGNALKIEGLSSIYEMINLAIYHLERNANARILFLNLSLQITNSIRDSQKQNH